MLRSPLQWIPVQPKALGHTYTQAAYGRTLVGPHNVGCVFVFVFPYFKFSNSILSFKNQVPYTNLDFWSS